MKNKFKRPIDLKKIWETCRHLKIEDIKEYRRLRKERRERILEERRNSPRGKQMQKIYGFMNRFSLLFHALLACGINLGIEAVSRHSLIEAFQYMVGVPLVFLYNAFMIFCTFSVVYLVKRRVFARIIISVLWGFIGVSNGYMLMKRVTPFNAQDLKVAKDGVTLINNYFNGFELMVLVIGIAAVVAWVISMWKRGGQYQGKLRRIPALLGIALCIVGYIWITDLAIEKRVVSTYFGNIAFAYEDYGLPYCFMASVFNTGITEPNNYNEKEIDRITENGAINKNEADNKSQMPNILFVQLESYFDIEEVEFFTTSEDVTPNLHQMAQQYSTGYFKVPSIGAGTANTEFEVLTGMNLRFFGPGEYPYKTMLKDNTCESAATALAALGYGTHALHNNGGNFYSRSRVFNNIGFDSFTSKEFMNILQTTEKGWAKDDVLLQHIEDAMNSTEQQDFVFTVSVQGHGDYPAEKVLENPKIKVEGIEDEALKNRWEYYVNQVYEMDQFAGNLVKQVEKRKEPTVIVFYGDHLPTLGLKAEDLKGRYLYDTNYVIWDNIGLAKEDRNIPAYQIAADVFDRLGIHSGTVFNYHQERRKTKKYLPDLELLQYDLLYGKQYTYRDHTPTKEGHMIMGMRDVTLDKIIPHLGAGYSLYGTNFTKSSKVYINGEKQKSTFLNNTRIELNESELSEGDVIVIRQVGSSDTVFRSSNEYIYKNGGLEVQEGTGTDLSKSWVSQLHEEKK